MKIYCFIISLLVTTYCLQAQTTLNVGPGRTYANPVTAAAAAKPGDTILIHPANYRGPFFISNLKGRRDAFIFIKGTNRDQVIFDGGSESLHFSDAEFIHISNITVRGQTGNGMNIDDAGSLESPTKHVILDNCVFRDMAASGNNDLLKLSGLDSFIIRHCHFENGATGGSGIDMVGCHAGTIRNNRFIQLGSNSIQAKGASSEIEILSNHFTNGGQRTLNLGGSTGSAFFRPAGANYEARNILAAANIIEGSVTPVAFVGSRNVRFINNTIIRPERWILRILQESSDTSFYLSSANNSFINNIVVVNNSLSTDVNIGPNTSPTTFKFSNNLWYHLDNANWRGPQLPVIETQGIVQMNPQFMNLLNGDYRLLSNSPAIGKGKLEINVKEDYSGKFYLNPPSIGAYEGGLATSTHQDKSNNVLIYPNPFDDVLHVQDILGTAHLQIYDLRGNLHFQTHLDSASHVIDLENLCAGFYMLKLKFRDGEIIRKLVKY
ncbi:MAG: right-handed parallel beta-helix repeat-containing protein [Saprospiraceae bacterium]|nr:right-handed parallel beta-helix repeat-containing protein [Saprospiraceae bacterium]